MRVGPYTIHLLTSDLFCLDGGAMFGSVPKVLWQKSIAADSLNRIPLACNLLVLEREESRLLVDVGMGQKWSDKEVSIYGIEYLTAEPLHLLVPGVTAVILTHLHFDHAGGISYRDERGAIQPSFPHASVYLSRKNLEHAQRAGVREKASYLSENIDAAVSGKLCLTEGGEEIFPEIWVYNSDGHTHGLQWVVIGSGKGAVAYPSDLIPTAHHLSVPWVMGYDLCAETSMREKSAFLHRAVAEEWKVVFEHDRDTPCATLIFDERGRPVIKERIEIPRFEELAARPK